MTYREFKKWCNDRSCDGCWGIKTSIVCIGIIVKIDKMPFWKREGYWKINYEHMILNEIVIPIQNKISEIEKGGKG